MPIGIERQRHVDGLLVADLFTRRDPPFSPIVSRTNLHLPAASIRYPPVNRSTMGVRRVFDEEMVVRDVQTLSNAAPYVACQAWRPRPDPPNGGHPGSRPTAAAPVPPKSTNHPENSITYTPLAKT